MNMNSSESIGIGIGIANDAREIRNEILNVRWKIQQAADRRWPSARARSLSRNVLF